MMRLQRTSSLFSTQCDVAMDTLKLCFLLCVELEESKSGKGRDSGERGPLFEDGEGHEESEATDTNLHQGAGVS